MKIVVATTTIHVPHALKAFRAADADVFFCITGDRKSPDAEIVRALDGLGNYLYMSIDQQHKRGYACDKLLGEGTIGRRSIALLEALRMKADAVVFWDSDNLMMSTDYFDRFEMVLGASFSGLKIEQPGCWFDPGHWQYPRDGRPVCQRGFPQHHPSYDTLTYAVDAKVGVAQGIILGDPDTSAVDRISRHPIVHSVNEMYRAGVVVGNSMWTITNSQNTAFLRELAPCFLMVPQWGRYDDIFSSLICQRIMRETGHVVYLGQPFTYQNRNPHDLVKDLKAELWGMEHVVEFANWLDDFGMDQFASRGPTVLEIVRWIYTHTQEFKWMPPGVGELGLAWCEDVEKVL